MRKFIYLSSVTLMLLASCGTRKVQKEEKVEEIVNKVDSVSSKKVDSAAVVKTDVVEEKKTVDDVREILNVDEFYFTPIDETQDAEFEVMVNDKVYKGKVKNGSISNKRQDINSHRVSNVSENNKTVTENSVKVKAEEKTKVNKKHKEKKEDFKKITEAKRGFPWWILILLILVAAAAYLTYNKYKDKIKSKLPWLP